MMYEAFQLTLNQVSGSIGQDAMSMELLCIIDVSHRIDKNISKIASIAISFFFLKWQKATVHIKHKKPPTFLILKQFWLGANLWNDKLLPKIFLQRIKGLNLFHLHFQLWNEFCLKKGNMLVQGPLLQIVRCTNTFTHYIFLLLSLLYTTKPVSLERERIIYIYSNFIIPCLWH